VTSGAPPPPGLAEEAGGGRPLVVVLGPTATGKSDVAAHLAIALDGEVIGADSMQVYRGMDAATGKPPVAVRLRVPHHLIDVADPRRDFSLGDFVRAADRAVRDIRARGRVPIVAGGAGMYLRGFLKGLDPAPPRHARLRERLERLADRRGPARLHRMLQRLDPTAAAGVGPADRKRLVRGLERVLLGGGRAAAARWAGPDRHAALKVGLRMEPAALRRRIDARVDAMFAAGLVEETRRLLAQGVPPGGSALKALGYREAVEHLCGARDLAATVEAVKRHTWRFSRRQMTWFRSEKGVRWFDVPERGPAEICPEVASYGILHLPQAGHL
jgi:tRNA dimethylallyltransferase